MSFGILPAVSRFVRCLGIGLSVGLLALAVSPAYAEKKSGGAADWPQSEQTPLWNFAWVSDMHMDGSRLELIADAMKYIDEELKPRFLMITGDNNAHPAPLAASDPNETIGHRRQRFLKGFLEQHLRTPYVIIPGDDWPQDFDAIFGPKQYSFDFGGLHFMMLAPDRIYHGSGLEGLSVFDNPTFEWMQRDLERNRDKPMVVVIHEPIFPRTFIDAERVQKLLDGYPNCFAALQGHLHVDMLRRYNDRTYLVGAALGPAKQHAIRLVEVYPEGLMVRSIVYDAETKRFVRKGRDVKVAIPDDLQGKLSTPTDAGFAMTNYDAVPAHPLIEDPTLRLRGGELLKTATEFFILRDGSDKENP